jgi:hypothetical protein
MAKTQRKDFSRMFMGVARSEAGLRTDPRTGAVTGVGANWDLITKPISEASKEAKDNFDARIKEQANKFDRNEIDLGDVPVPLQNALTEWTTKMGNEYDKWNNQHAKYVNRARNCTAEDNKREGSDCFYLNEALQGMNNVKTAFETLGSQKDQFIQWRKDFMNYQPKMSDGNEDNIKFMHNALADQKFEYFTDSKGSLNINDDGEMSFSFTLDGNSGTIDFADFAGKSSLLLTNRSTANVLFQSQTNELGVTAASGSLYNSQVANKDYKDQYPGYYDGDAKNDYLFSTAYKSIPLKVEDLFNKITEEDFTVMIFDGATDWNNDGNHRNDQQIVDSYLFSNFNLGWGANYWPGGSQFDPNSTEHKKMITLVTNLKEAGFNVPDGYFKDNPTRDDYTLNGTLELLKNAMRAGFYWNIDGDIVDVNAGGDFRDSAISQLLRNSITKFWEGHVEQMWDPKGASSGKGAIPTGLPTS